jgi:periplasmic mercuric ion binding protein
MTKVIASVAVGLLLLLGLAGGFLHPGGGQAVAGGPGEKTVTLGVKNMYCAACPSIVKKSLEAVPGVAQATVSYKDKTAVVIYDDSKTTVPALVKATTEAGYPSAPKN